MALTKVDVPALVGALDAVRSDRNWSWRQLAKEVGVSPSLLSRMTNGYRPDADGFVTLVQWLGMPVEQFTLDTAPADPVSRPEPSLTAQLAPLLRARHDLEPEDVEYLEDVIRATVRRTKAKQARNDAE